MSVTVSDGCPPRAARSFSAPSQRVTQEHWSDTDHPCIKRSGRFMFGTPVALCHVCGRRVSCEIRRRWQPSLPGVGTRSARSGSWAGCLRTSVGLSWSSTRGRWNMPVTRSAGSSCSAFCGGGDSMPTLPESRATGRRWMLLAGRSAAACCWRRLSVRTARPGDLAAVAGRSRPVPDAGFAVWGFRHAGPGAGPGLR
jgi:hypothetical protein